MQDKTSIIIPTYNEAGNIKNCVETITRVLEEQAITFEIIIVDDNSPDGTYEVTKVMAKYDQRIKPFVRRNEKGLSSAVTFGYDKASGDKLIVVDADFQHDYTKIPDLIQLLNENDIVVATRRSQDGGYGNFPILRKLASLFATKISEWLFPVKISDPMSGFFGIRKSVYLDTKDKLHPRGYKILFEILGVVKTDKIAEIGYTFGLRTWGHSKLDSFVIFYFLWDLVSIKWNQWKESHPLLYGSKGRNSHTHP
ncbi:glycosyltransferase, group 2 family protein [Leptospira yanagawae serovar Saopaulo str. Sao Paulo = ATCC 700523]|uniref:Glycosyltransferase, group 2 family protein n=1 Tax=Leptospira yanagawae serovar Saopaulo str. Sao Paulo = ATCC 700523 TaxID=1249483 RepID=A0A5E8HAD8_9LEPT|nr:polyprenol monophosphomannose synthase [Leptospira yanagawae]EOQ87610.1 glycosyltransferase, group 2 family protein [Leptospira yanagawae serovar Saopaulo str. Sao Paulo = ATCC 700523]